MGWAALLILFAASLLTVFGWLLQYGRGLWLARARGGRGPTLAAEPAGSPRELGVWRSLLRLRAARAGTAEEPGVRGLLASLFAFKSFRENWQRAWVRALNEQACRDGVSWMGPLGGPCSFSIPGRGREERGQDASGDRLGSSKLTLSLADQRKRVQWRLRVEEIQLRPHINFLWARYSSSRPLHKFLFS